MTVAEGSQTRLAYLVETAIGVIPATPSWKSLRYTSESITLEKQTAIPDEIRDDRNVSDIVDVGRSVTGPINGVLSYGTYDDLLAALFCSDWTGDVLKNGRTPKTLAFEKTFEQGATDAYTRYRGCRINTLDLQLNAKQFITANFGVMGLGSPTPATTIITGATYAAATTTPVLNAALNIGTLTMGGIAASPKLQAASIRINNNIYANEVLGQYETYSHGLGRFDVSGSVTALFENLDLYNAILNHDDLSLALTVGAATGAKYTLAIPKMKGMSGGPMVRGNNQSVIIEMPFQAKFDPTSAASMTLTRAVA
ncbi:phage tail tube protein [Rhizobium sp. Leaf383]|uniref:phage tail tube protein n=1 Tax=Rhizobium sp. Leaf383 TaxID=1736357 RepID=UPI000715F67D|nr:phage tail tube protein [Rhizobium sp. Leaf383]KQS83422.1 hypothetical protein ASG58_22060 [Rhizobium sp. Leaf383]